MANRYFGTSIGRKFLMALSALFLIVFLVVHLLINFLSVINADLFNQASDFMGTNPLIQFLFQPILFIGVIFHFVMGFILELKNKASRSAQYVKSRPDENSSVFSRYMVYTGATILLFLGLHMVDFFFPSFSAHHITHEHLDSYVMVTEKFQNPVYVVIYVLAFVFLGFHLIHGFQSAFQSIGMRHPKYLPFVQNFGKAFSVIVPLGFVFIAVFHYYFN